MKEEKSNQSNESLNGFDIPTDLNENVQTESLNLGSLLNIVGIGLRTYTEMYIAKTATNYWGKLSIILKVMVNVLVILLAEVLGLTYIIAPITLIYCVLTVITYGNLGIEKVCQFIQIIKYVWMSCAMAPHVVPSSLMMNQFLKNNGFIGNSDDPIKCHHCGSTHFKEVITESMGYTVIEKDCYCDNCGEYLNSWHTGDWMTPFN